ncbi:MAG: hypothetical protein RDV41_02110, partial [Planctomycetota bacterium]|nr:hypothetical protein [Planctomycetota bacterium]
MTLTRFDLPWIVPILILAPLVAGLLLGILGRLLFRKWTWLSTWISFAVAVVSGWLLWGTSASQIDIVPKDCYWKFDFLGRYAALFRIDLTVDSAALAFIWVDTMPALIA